MFLKSKSNTFNSNLQSLFWLSLIIALFYSHNVSATVMEDTKADMGLNEAPLLGVSGKAGWHKGAVMFMGSSPRGDNTPTYWRPDNQVFKSSAYWNAHSNWFVIFKGEANTATNVRVKISDMHTYILRKSTNAWEEIEIGTDNPTWAGLYTSSLQTTGWIGTAKPRTEPDGKLSYKLTPDSAAIHGGRGRVPISGSDVAASFSRLTTELILDDPNGVDDRHLAQILVSVGADYYPTMTTKVAEYAPMNYGPGVAASRFGLVSAVPRTHYYATIDPPGQAKDVSLYQLAGGISSIPVSEFESNPPPGISITTPVPPTPDPVPPDTDPNIDTTTPSAPTSLQVITSFTQTDLSWEASTDNVAVTGYKIYRNGEEIGTSINTSFSSTLKLVSRVSKYTVKAYDAAGNLSDSSNLVTVRQTKDRKTILEPTIEATTVSDPISQTNSTYLVTGSTGETVNKLQTFLINESFLTPENDTGLFDLETEQAVKNFQYAYGIVLHGQQSVKLGIVDESTALIMRILGGDINPVALQVTPVVTLTPTSCPTAVNLTENLFFGIERSSVTVLQCKLIKLGHLEAGNAVGFFGPKTLKAVKQLQCANTLTCSGDAITTGYGFVGPKTRAILNQVI